MSTNWTLVRTTQPSVLPVSLVEAKAHLRLSSSDTTHDDNLTLLLNAATERVEQDLDRQLISCSFRQDQFCWNENDNAYGEVNLKKKSVTGITSVSYYDTDGTLQALSSSLYSVDLGRGSIFTDPDTEWPTLKPRKHNAVSIVFTAGFGSDATTVPRVFKQAILLCIGKWFYDPGQEGSALHSQEVAYDRLINLLHRPAY